MNIICTCQMPFQDFLIEIYKKYVFMVNSLSKDNNVTVIFPQKKIYREFMKTTDPELKFDSSITFVNAYKTTFMKSNEERDHWWFDEENFLKIFTEESYDKIIVFSPPCCSNSVVKKVSNTFDGKYVRLKYESLISKIYQYGMLYALHRKFNCNVYQIVNDFNEPIIQKTWPFAKTLSYYKTADGLEGDYIFDICTFKNGFVSNEKIYDFSFAFTVTFGSRMYLSDFVHSYIQENDKILIHEKNRYKGIMNSIDQSVYYDELSKTKFTMIAPATKKGRFSWFRFTEALSRKCIPLLLENSNYMDALGSYPELLSIYNKYNLYVSYTENVNDKINNLDYDTIWLELENSDCMKELLNTDKLYSKFLHAIA